MNLLRHNIVIKSVAKIWRTTGAASFSCTAWRKWFSGETFVYELKIMLTFLVQDSFCVHPDVSSAVQCGEPVVALETTIVTHGMPHPHNIETALAVEEEVRRAGAVPASIGVLDGTVHVGEPQRVEAANTFYTDQITMNMQ